MMPWTIVLWKWRGWNDIYNAGHVNRMLGMLERTMSVPYRPVCITDDPTGVYCETFPLWQMPEVRIPAVQPLPPRGKLIPNCYTRLRIFDPRVGMWFGDRILSIDLDAVILDDLAPLLTDDPFRAARGMHSPFCGTLWQLLVGEHADVWYDFDPVETPKLVADTMHGDRPISGSDQAWLSIKIPDAPTWGEGDGVYWFKTLKPKQIPKNARYIYFAGNIKPWGRECQMINPELYDAYWS